MSLEPRIAGARRQVLHGAHEELAEIRAIFAPGLQLHPQWRVHRYQRKTVRVVLFPDRLEQPKATGRQERITYLPHKSIMRPKKGGRVLLHPIQHLVVRPDERQEPRLAEMAGDGLPWKIGPRVAVDAANHQIGHDFAHMGGKLRAVAGITH
jgi:hypothetical protein